MWRWNLSCAAQNDGCQKHEDEICVACKSVCSLGTYYLGR